MGKDGFSWRKFLHYLPQPLFVFCCYFELQATGNALFVIPLSILTLLSTFVMSAIMVPSKAAAWFVATQESLMPTIAGNAYNKKRIEMDVLKLSIWERTFCLRWYWLCGSPCLCFCAPSNDLLSVVHMSFFFLSNTERRRTYFTNGKNTGSKNDSAIGVLEELVKRENTRQLKQLVLHCATIYLLNIRSDYESAVCIVAAPHREKSSFAEILKLGSNVPLPWYGWGGAYCMSLEILHTTCGDLINERGFNKWRMLFHKNAIQQMPLGTNWWPFLLLFRLIGSEWHSVKSTSVGLASTKSTNNITLHWTFTLWN